MFFSCELQKLRQLKTYLLASARCEKILNSLPGQLESRIENCPELAELKAAEENLKIQKEWDANNRKKRTRGCIAKRSHPKYLFTYCLT